MNYGLALITEFHDDDKIAVSLGCERLGVGQLPTVTDKRAVLAEYWFDSERDREACISYCDTYSMALSHFLAIAPDDVKVRFGGAV